MNIIQELTEKYSGKYSEDLNKSVNSPIGKYTFQPKSGIIEVDGTKISISLNEVGGANPATEPFRMTLYLDKAYETQLTIFPKTFWNKILDALLPKRNEFIPKPIRKQFWFNGHKGLLNALVSDKIFTDNILNERVFIKTVKKPTHRIVLTPEFGIRDIDQFEKFVSILKRIENKIKSAHKLVSPD